MRQGLFLHSFFRIIALAALYLVVATMSLHAYERECGTMQVIERLMQQRKHNHGYAQTHIAAKDNSEETEKCPAEVFYDSVYTIETQHFQIMYVLTGPHATTKAFADSTAANMEEAWNFYVNKRKMRKPKAPSRSYHFQKKIKEGLYAVEIVELNQIRKGIGGCAECFAITYPLEDDGTSQIFMDNDFYYPSAFDYNADTVFVNGDTCTYVHATLPLQNITHNFSYADEWAKAIRLTSFHELYHAVQLSYITMFTNYSFWFEASAAGFEEVTNPEIDDYIRYTSDIFDRMGQPLSGKFRNYAASTLFLYLYNKVSKDLDRSIWENYAKNPYQDFEFQLATALQTFKLDADSIFHDYAVRLSFSGNRSSAVNKKDWINDDQSQWSNAKFIVKDSIAPKIESLAFTYYRIPHSYSSRYTIDFTDFIGKGSVATYNKGKASIHPIQNNRSLDSLSSILATADSSTWIFSRLGQSESIPIINKTAAPHAYPVPWRHGPLCFAPLPKDKKFIEIRNRRGDLVSQEKYGGTSYCLQEDKVKSMMAPGIYHFRVGNKGKTTKFIVAY